MFKRCYVKISGSCKDWRHLLQSICILKFSNSCQYVFTIQDQPTPNDDVKVNVQSKVRFPTNNGLPLDSAIRIFIENAGNHTEFYTWMPQEALYAGSQIKKKFFSILYSYEKSTWKRINISGIKNDHK